MGEASVEFTTPWHYVVKGVVSCIFEL